MSISKNYYEDVFRSPNNKSSAKMLYSFPKADRFSSRKKLLCDKMYNLPPAYQKRATTFGYGYKSDFTKTSTLNPSPTNYIIKSLFEVNKQKKIGSAFGKGRQEMQDTGPLALLKTNTNPGPGAYIQKSTLSKSTYSFAARHPIEDTERRLVPGPGTYQTPFPFNNTGRYYLAKYKTSRASSFSAGEAKRFLTKIQKTPGPGAYKVDLKPAGPDFVSKFKSSMAQSFPHTARKAVINQQKDNPGPGYYELPTEFGSLQNQQNKQNVARREHTTTS